MEPQEILRVEDLAKHFTSGRSLLAPGRARRVVKAVDGVSFSLARGRTLGLVGESGCGKSTTGRMIARLLDPTAGRVVVDGQDTAGLRGKDLYHFRRKVQMVFQDPFASLNPRQTIGSAIAAPFEAQRITPAGGVKRRVGELMERVGLKPEHYNRFPHEFSGGQRQRVGIARALALEPSVIVCDEPVSALDVSVQAQVVNLLEEIQEDTGVAYVFIAHDLSVVRHISDEIAVMYLGKVVERGPVEELYSSPQHPYTRALLSAVPIPDPRAARAQVKIRLRGDLPSPANPPSGCVFRTRCPLMATLAEPERERCSHEVPEPASFGRAACHFADSAALT
ncbi:oligopeptide/dipeptide ABC transporter ATP-binding protein [Sinomonas sp. ASV322]|uniref:ABC transporter ATP-binding protein n=1 Tax=Sinomonas sp. ASV322 TaxID=3041920 RepID=UPI0027DC0C46|nr:oligopeptide/dipeptide ABC transporter ATP-binding protein [Sinomonas sp. ASV322]MDQ4501272.1 ATP-binding cassette domain-containing protein [Sinomonas sp. ASV322]